MLFDLKEVDLKKGLILLYGSPSSGKSTLAMQTSLNLRKKGKVLYFNCGNNFSIDRIKLMSSEIEKELENIIIFNIKEFDEFVDKLNKIEDIIKKGKFCYLIIDSFGIFYRYALHNQNYTEVNDKIISLLRKLKHVSKDIPVLITSEIYSSEGGNKSIGGNMIRNFSDAIIELSTNPRKLVFHKPEKLQIRFDINNSGFFRL